MNSTGEVTMTDREATVGIEAVQQMLEELKLVHSLVKEKML